MNDLQAFRRKRVHQKLLKTIADNERTLARLRRDYPTQLTVVAPKVASAVGRS